MSEQTKGAWSLLPAFARVAAAMALVASLHLPYSYYRLVRLVVTTAAIGLVLKLKGSRKHFVPLILVALLFNPIVPVHLTRALWVVADIGAGLYLLFLANKISAQP